MTEDADALALGTRSALMSSAAAATTALAVGVDELDETLITVVAAVVEVVGSFADDGVPAVTAAVVLGIRRVRSVLGRRLPTVRVPTADSVALRAARGVDDPVVEAGSGVRALFGRADLAECPAEEVPDLAGPAETDPES